MLKSQPPIDEDQEYVSYDVESLFTNIPLEDTILYVLNQIYVNNRLPQICKKSIFKKLLMKVTKDSTFQFCNTLYKQIDGCSMGGPLSVTLADIFMIKMEQDIVVPSQPIFYKRYVDDIFYCRKKEPVDKLLENLNRYHKNIKLTVEINPSKFLDTEITSKNKVIQTKVYRKPNKMPIPWSSNVPKRYKRNAINGDLHRSKKISSNLNQEIIAIRDKYKKADYPSRFTESVIREFLNPSLDKDDFIIPPFLFEELKPVILIELPFCDMNEVASKQFIKKLINFTNDEYCVRIKWLTRKTKSLFKVKDTTLHPSCKIYQGICSCSNVYIGETIRNVEVRWNEHNDPRGKSEPSKHLTNNLEHKFQWSIICNAPINTRSRKNLEAFYIALQKPSLNEQLDNNQLNLFRNGIT